MRGGLSAKRLFFLACLPHILLHVLADDDADAAMVLSCWCSCFLLVFLLLAGVLASCCTMHDVVCSPHKSSSNPTCGFIPPFWTARLHHPCPSSSP